MQISSEFYLGFCFPPLAFVTRGTIVSSAAGINLSPIRDGSVEHIVLAPIAASGNPLAPRSRPCGGRFAEIACCRGRGV